MTVDVVFALQAEFAPWRRLRRFHPPNGACGAAAHQARIGSTRVRVLTSGIGAPRLQPLLDAMCIDPPDLVISAGLSGGLKPSRAAGAILVARTLRGDDGAIEVDQRLVAAASKDGATIVDAFVCSRTVVRRAADKLALGRDGDAVDMESLAVIAAAQARGVRGVAIRVVGDAAGEDVPLDVTPALTEDGDIDFRRLVWPVLRRPHRWPAMVRFGAAQRRALTRLARFLDRFVETAG